MSRDIEDRITLFAGSGVEVNRIALNMDQVDEYSPPPNPTKLTDSRATPYVQKYGNESWELDALQPDLLASLVEETVLEYRDEDIWEEALAKQEENRARLEELADDNRDFLDTDEPTKKKGKKK